MLSVSNYWNGELCLGIQPYYPYNLPKWVNHPTWMTLPFIDTFWDKIRMYDFIVPGVNLDDICHLDFPKSGETKLHIGFTPIVDFSNLLRSYVGWSQFVTNIAAMLKDWNFRRGLVTIDGENPVLHFNLKGEMGNSGSSRNWINEPKSIYSEPITGCFTRFIPSIANQTLLSLTLDQDHGIFDPHPGDGASWALFQDEFDIADFDYLFSGNPLTPVRFGRFSLRIDDKGDITHLQYAVEAEDRLGSQHWYKGVWSVTARFSYSVISTELVSDELNTISSFIEPHIDVATTLHYCTQCMAGDEESMGVSMESLPWFPDFDEAFTYGELISNYTPSCYFLTYPEMTSNVTDELVCDLTGVNMDGSFRHNGVASLSRFQTVSLSVLSDCFPAAALASRDAVDKEFESLGSNYLENLSQLSELMKIVDLPAFLRSLRRIKKSKGEALLSILDVLTDLHLIYSFGLAPSISDAKSLASRAKPLLSSFTSINDTVRTMRGKFTFAIPDEFTSEFVGCRMVARSTLRYSLNTDSFLSALLPIRSLGLLPTLSNLWDLVPFSFLVDYALHLGQHQDLIETSAMMLSLNLVHSIQSIAIFYDFSEEDFARYEIQSAPLDGDAAPGFKTYCRYVSDTFPVVGPSRFGLFDSSGLSGSQIAILGSLAYKLIT